MQLKCISAGVPNSLELQMPKDLTSPIDVLDGPRTAPAGDGSYGVEDDAVSIIFGGCHLQLGIEEFWEFMELMSKAALSLAEQRLTGR